MSHLHIDQGTATEPSDQQPSVNSVAQQRPIAEDVSCAHAQQQQQQQAEQHSFPFIGHADLMCLQSHAADFTSKDAKDWLISLRFLRTSMQQAGWPVPIWSEAELLDLVGQIASNNFGIYSVKHRRRDCSHNTSPQLVQQQQQQQQEQQQHQQQLQCQARRDEQQASPSSKSCHSSLTCQRTLDSCSTSCQPALSGQETFPGPSTLAPWPMQGSRQLPVSILRNDIKPSADIKTPRTASETSTPALQIDDSTTVRAAESCGATPSATADAGAEDGAEDGISVKSSSDPVARAMSVQAVVSMDSSTAEAALSGVQKPPKEDAVGWELYITASFF